MYTDHGMEIMVGSKMPVTKVSEIRKQEFFDAAVELVNERGYDNITIQSLIDKLGVSKGAFYHYFKSKQELLDVIITHYTKRVVKKLQKVVDDKKLNALQKFNKMVFTAKEFKAAQREINIEFIKLIRQGSISLISSRALEISMEIVRPIWLKIVCQGVEEGIFDIPYPEEMTTLLIHVANNCNATLGRIFLESTQKSNLIETLKKQIQFYEDTFERLLGVEKGSIDLAGPYLKNIELYRKILEENNLL